MKKRFIAFIALVNCISYTTYPTESIIIDNPYATAVKAGMLTSKDATKKEKFLTEITKKTTSITPYLSLIESYYTSN
ncbi:hypothetical protein KAH94_05080, partial [bacterium]|nr:hypothetical protein [bacterium]